MTEANTQPASRDDDCRSCGVSPAPAWDTPDGRVALCSACAVLHGIGCP